MRATLAQESFAGLNVTSATLMEITFRPNCGNGYCEIGEAMAQQRQACPVDCESLSWCPVAPADTGGGHCG